MIRRAIVFSGLLYISSVYAGDDASSWLMKMRDASQSLNYDGVFVYVYSGKLEAMRVVHQVKDGILRERIYSMNGAPREVIRDDKRVWCYVPDKKIGVRESRHVSFPSILPTHIENLKSNYKFLFERHERISDRMTRVIAVKPVDDFRYGYNLWVDEQSGLILKASLLDTDDKPIEQYMFTQVSIGAEIPDEALQPMTPKKELSWFRGDEADEKNSGIKNEGSEHLSNWQTQIPKGYMLSYSVLRKSPMSKRMMEHFVYSDGLAAVSLFIEKSSKGAKPFSGANRMGAVHAFGKIVDGYQITVVGEVPAKTVGMIGDSVSRK